MKRFPSIIAAVLAVSLLSCDQATRDQRSGAKEALWKLEHEWARAVQHRDVDSISRILADEYEFTGPGGEIWTKTRVLDFIKAGDLQINSFGLVDIKVRSYGATAVVNFRVVWNGTSRGVDISGPQQMTDVFVCRDGCWQCVASQTTPILSTSDSARL